MSGPEGEMVGKRVDPHGVLVALPSKQLSIDKSNLPIIGRFFLAAAVLLGEDVNAGWADEQSTQPFGNRHGLIIPKELEQ